MPDNVVGLFDRTLEAEDAIDELQKSGISRDQISIIAKETSAASDQQTASASAGAGAGAVIGGIAGLVAGLGALAIPGLGPIIAGGPLAMAIGSAGVGAAAGGIIGALTGMNIPESDANYYAEGVRNGRALVLVRAEGIEAEHARDILNQSGAQIESHAPDRPPSGARVYVDGLDFAPKRSRFEEFEADYRDDFDARNLGGQSFDQFSPAYRYGYNLGTDARYTGKDWLTIEDRARKEWEARNPGTWEQIKEIVRYAWNAVRQPRH